jgi:nucleoside-diphosphate-sugar epimerase
MRAYIVLPSMIYGLGDGPLFRARISNRHSLQLPSIVRASLLCFHAGTIGPGTNVWPNVHIADTADAFLVLLDALRADPERPGHGWEGFYFLENGHHSECAHAGVQYG